MKKLLYISIMIMAYSIVNAQQMPQFTQYMFNDFVINPAIAGTKEYYQARSNNRYQWMGIVDSPRTYMLSLYGPDKKRDMGYGGYAFNDVTGPTSRTGVFGAYSYGFQINDKIKAALGLSVGVLQFKIDGSKVTLHDNVPDPSFGEAMYVEYVPDATFGAYCYAEEFWGGFGISQLFGNKISYEEVTAIDKNNLKRHVFVNGGYFYDLNDDFDIEPSILFKGVSPVPLHMDLAVRGIYRNIGWFGVSFRTGFKNETTDAISLMAGYNYDNQVIIGYSYDITLSNIKRYSSGTHELMIGFRFNKIKQSSGSKAKIY